MDYFALLSGPVAGDWRHFLHAWVGETDAGWGLPEDPVDWTLSRSLKDFYRTVARWDDLQVHLRLIPTTELSPGPDGRTVFLVEEQGVYEWAVTSDADTDLVWGRYPGGGEWQPERELLPRFLTQVVFHLGVMHPPHGAVANRIPIADLRRALAPMKLLPFGSWRWPSEPTYFYAGNDIMAVVCPWTDHQLGYGDGFSAWIGAKTEGAIRYLDSIVNEETWGYYSRWDPQPYVIERLR